MASSAATSSATSGPGGQASLRGRLRWRSMRRGLLELDIVFDRFLRNGFDDLDPAQLELFGRLLDWEDTDLWEILSGRRDAEQTEFKELVELLRRA